MNTSEIKKLLDTFYNGETNTGEEQILMDYFKGEDVAEELMDERDIFLGIYQADSIDVPSSLESKLNNLIDELEEKGAKGTKPLQTKRRLMTWIGSAAASIAILISVGLYLNNRPETVVEPPLAYQQDNNPEQLSEEDRKAVQEAEEALMLLSSKFNKGVKQMAVVSDNIEKTNEILNKTFNRKKDKES